MARHRRIKPPVLSRLTWAWISAFSAMVLIAVGISARIYFGPEPGRVALQIGDLETLANQHATDGTVSEDRLAPPGDLRLAPPAATRIASASAPGEESDDLLIYPDGSEYFLSGPAPDSDDDDSEIGEIRISISGATDSTPAQAGQPTLGSLNSTRDRFSIPDPDPELLRSTPLGKVPRIGPDGRKALTTYIRPFRPVTDNPPVAIIIGGLGLNRGLTERAIDELPPEISLAFAPYAKDLPFWTEKARRAGHEVLIELPMEGYGPNQQALGAAGLLTSRTSSENLQRLDWLMSRFGGYFAATNYLGAKFSSDNDALQPVLQKLREAGIGYIDDTGAARDIADKANLPSVQVSRIIPPSPDDSGRSAVKRELKALSSIARADGAALGKTYAYAVTLEEIAVWAAKAEENGIQLAPASTILQKRSRVR